ncbi:MAG TPA: universal stress protein [Gaiellaceae bacterium]|nr:universal stress protein [Gaiellaceae bacterium]
MSGTIVVGYDGKEQSEPALAKAAEEAKAAGSTVVVVAVEYMPVEPEIPSRYGFDPTGPDDLAAPGTEPPPSLKPTLVQAETKLVAAGVRAIYVWGAGDPARVIVETAREHRAAKIMIGPDHHGFFGRLFGDDVEAEVRRQADCDVVVVS